MNNDQILWLTCLVSFALISDLAYTSWRQELRRRHAVTDLWAATGQWLRRLWTPASGLGHWLTWRAVAMGKAGTRVPPAVGAGAFEPTGRQTVVTAAGEAPADAAAENTLPGLSDSFPMAIEAAQPAREGQPVNVPVENLALEVAPDSRRQPEPLRSAPPAAHEAAKVDTARLTVTPCADPTVVKVSLEIPVGVKLALSIEARPPEPNSTEPQVTVQSLTPAAAMAAVVTGRAGGVAASAGQGALPD